MLAACAALALLAAACGTTPVGTEPTVGPTFLDLGDPVDIPPLPELDAASIAAGRDLYLEHCASCHGRDLKGDPDWMTPNDDGSYPPPPQDSTGHTWHHSDQLLVDIIRNGSEYPQSRMPSFGHLLDDEAVLSILDYFKSTWGPTERDMQWTVTLRDAAQPEG
jgi:mono/diheme cytochrome c family protein